MNFRVKNFSDIVISIIAILIAFQVYRSFWFQFYLEEKFTESQKGRDALVLKIDELIKYLDETK